MVNLIFLLFALSVTPPSFPANQPVFVVQSIDTLSHNQTQTIDIEADIGLYGTVKGLESYDYALDSKVLQEIGGRENLYISFKEHPDYIVIVYPEYYLNLKGFYHDYKSKITSISKYIPPETRLNASGLGTVVVYCLKNGKQVWTGNITSGTILVSYYETGPIGVSLFLSDIKFDPKFKI